MANAVAEVRRLQDDKHEPFLRSVSQLLDKLDDAACARWKVMAYAELTALAYPLPGQEYDQFIDQIGCVGVFHALISVHE